ncbi:MAG: DsbA family protein [Pseudomonadota bacterium]
MINLSRFGFVGVAALLLAACGSADSSSGSETDSAASSSSDTTPSADADKQSTASVAISDSDMILGSADAPVTIIEYASLTCPACASFHIGVFPQIKEKFVDTGQVRFVFREFPTPPFDFSLIGSVLSRCAAEKTGSDGYFLMIGSLFKTQRAWIHGEDPKLELLKIASQAGMDEAAFDTCLQDRQDLVDLVRGNAEAASEEYNITGTPTLILDDKKLTYRSAEELENKIQAAVDAAGGASSDEPTDG